MPTGEIDSSIVPSRGKTATEPLSTNSHPTMWIANAEEEIRRHSHAAFPGNAKMNLFFHVLPDHEPMPVGRPDAELAHSPRLIRGLRRDLDTEITNLIPVRIQVVNDQICKVGMIAQIRGRDRVGTFPEHHHARVTFDETPPLDAAHLRETKNPRIELSRGVHIGHGKHVVVPKNRRHGRMVT